MRHETVFRKARLGWIATAACCVLAAFPVDASANWGSIFEHPGEPSDSSRRTPSRLRWGLEGGATWSALEGHGGEGVRDSRVGWSLGLMFDLQKDRPFYTGGSIDLERRISVDEQVGNSCGFCPPEYQVWSRWTTQYQLTYLSGTYPTIGFRRPRGSIRPYVRVAPTLSFLLAGNLEIEVESPENHRRYDSRFTKYADRLEFAASGALGVVLKTGSALTSIELRYLHGFDSVGGDSGETDGGKRVPGQRKNRMLALIAGVGF